MQLDILATEDKVEEIVNTIVKSGRTGKVGDGKIVVLEVHSATRIRTGETGSDAI